MYKSCRFTSDFTEITMLTLLYMLYVNTYILCQITCNLYMMACNYVNKTSVSILLPLLLYFQSVNTELDDPSKTCSEMKCKNKKKKGGKKGNNKGRKKGGKKEGKKNKAKAAKRRNKKNGGAARVV